MTWTHNGAILGPKPRPWRLTRRQRVEMEAALAGFRARIVASPRRVDRLRDSEDVEDAPLTPGWGQTVPVEPGRMFPTERATRMARARVAIALRAALRADEDARCEEANAQFNDDESETLREMCEWREMRRGFGHDRRTLAEIARLPRSVWTWAAGSKEESERNLNADGERLYGIRIEATIPLALWERASLLPEPSTGVGG